MSSGDAKAESGLRTRTGVCRSETARCLLVKVDEDTGRPVELRMLEWSVQRGSGVLLIIPGGPGLVIEDLIGTSPTELLGDQTLAGYGTVIAVDPRGTESTSASGCSFLPAVGPVLVSDLKGECSDARFSASFSAAQVAADIDAVVSGFKFRKVDVVGHSWGGAIAEQLVRRAPKWLGAVTLDSPAVPLSYSNAVVDSVDIQRSRLRADRLLESAYKVLATLTTMEDARVRLDLAAIESLDFEKTRERFIAISKDPKHSDLSELLGKIRMGDIPISAYIPYICSTFVKQQRSSKSILQAIEARRSQPKTCENFAGFVARPIGSLPEGVRRGRIRVLCSRYDWVAPPAQCNRFATRLRVPIVWTEGTNHGSIFSP
jgi:pimeloyl-ACP methyl ester carboxylesterase